MELKFNAQGSDKLNWFSLSRLTQSPWSDIRTEQKDWFSIRGDVPQNRHFFINSKNGGCPSDSGWMLVAGSACSWEKHYLPRKHVILYSKRPGYTNWNHYREYKDRGNDFCFILTLLHFAKCEHFQTKKYIKLFLIHTLWLCLTNFCVISVDVLDKLLS